MSSNATNEKYWSEYTGLQEAKHELLSKYLGGWFPILAFSHGRVIYVDCHAGRGSHKTGTKRITNFSVTRVAYSPTSLLESFILQKYNLCILKMTQLTINTYARRLHH